MSLPAFKYDSHLHLDSVCLQPQEKKKNLILSMHTQLLEIFNLQLVNGVLRLEPFSFSIPPFCNSLLTVTAHTVEHAGSSEEAGGSDSKHKSGASM